MSRYRRWNELLELLAADGQLQVERAARVLGVSAATVRRDFDELARQQMLTRIRGGAVAKGVELISRLRFLNVRGWMPVVSVPAGESTIFLKKVL